MKIKISLLILIFIILIIGCQTKNDVPVSVVLDANWQFKKVTDSLWQTATVPGNIHTDLLELELIKDPFIGDNEMDVQWVSKADWEYKTNFSLDKESLQNKNIELNFEGLDTYASVFLNDSLILKANNAFRTWRVNVKSILKANNQLRILFESTSKYEDKEKAKLGYTLPDGDRVFTRKAQFQYGWDWGPKLNTLGIWRPISLLAWDDYKIDDIYVTQDIVNDSVANLKLEIKKFSNVALDKKLSYEVFVNNTLVKTSTELDKDSIWLTNFDIKNPTLWWPHNLGVPYLYDIKVIVKDQNHILDSISVKHGIRTIELISEKDSIGESFYFKVNNKSVYAKGANYIPQHSFQNKVSNKHYEKLLNDVVDANMNMLRVWGGGIYENDIFYDLCDEKGILVWQDFMFACAMYPGDSEFLDNVKLEAEDNVKRLRNHASIALWCGNNESSEGWKRWGWQANRNEAEKEEIWDNYLKIFDSILPQTVQKYTDIDYWETSPKYGRGNPKYKTEGDAHDWWVWHDAYPFEHLEDNVPRFMSEFGFQAFPSYEAIRYINQSDSLDISSEGFKNHQKHLRGFELIDEYMKRDFPVPNSNTERSRSEDYVYMSQLLQAYGITKGIEAQRRAKPYNMGTLYWQLNDVWPAVSWSSIDFMGNWKALHYKAKRSFDNVLVSSTMKDEVFKTWVVNDNLNSITGILNSKLIGINGKVYWENNQNIEVEADASQLVLKHDFSTLEFDRSASILVSTFYDKTSYTYFVKPKDLKLDTSKIEFDIGKTSDGFEITLSSKTFQKGVFLYAEVKGHFSNNYFDMLPNKPVKIHFNTEAESLKSLKFKSLNDFLK